jgi:hypothetical protein
MREAIPPLPQYAFMAMCSVKAQGLRYLYIHQVNRPQYPLLQHYPVTTPKAMVLLTPSFRVWNVFTDAALHMGFELIAKCTLFWADADQNEMLLKNLKCGPVKPI